MKFTIKTLAALVLTILLFSACEKDEEESIKVKEGKILIGTALPNPDGQSGSVYMQLIDNLETKTVNNKTSIPIPFYSAPIIIGDEVYILPGWTMETDILTKYKRVNGQLVKDGSMTLPSNSGATNIVTVKNKAYISCAMRGEILVIDKEKMTIIKKIDLKQFAIGDENPEPSVMIYRDGYIYIALNQMVGGYFPAKDRAISDVLIINTKTDKAVKMISEKTSQISQPSRPLDTSSMFMDEHKDIYVICLGAFGTHANQYGGILRIKAGEQEFDKDYKLVFNNTVIEGDENKTNLLYMCAYAGDGKLYGAAYIKAYESTPPNYIEDRTVASVEIDLYKKTIKKLDLPMSNSYGVAVGVHKNYVLFGLATYKSTGYFSYNIKTKKTSKEAIIKTTGYPMYIKSFNK